MAQKEVRPPDYKLQLREREGNARNNNTGVAWSNSKGTK